MFSAPRFIATVSAALVASLLVAHPAGGAPLAARQVGNLQCNINRVQTVGGLSTAQDAVTALGATGAPNATVAAAQQGLSQANTGIKSIVEALFQNKTAPADARTQVGDGLGNATAALASMNATNSAMSAALAEAQDAVNKTLAAGEQVVSDCK